MIDPVTPDMTDRCDAHCHIGRAKLDRVWCMLGRGHPGRHAAWLRDRWRYEWDGSVLTLII
jgi:hypothetical protein